MPARSRLVDHGEGRLLFRTEAHPALRFAVVFLLAVFFFCTWFAPFAGELWFRLAVLVYGALGILILGKYREHELSSGSLEIRSRAVFVRRTRNLPIAGARLELADQGGRTALQLVLGDGRREAVAVSRDAGALQCWAAAIGTVLPDGG